MEAGGDTELQGTPKARTLKQGLILTVIVALVPFAIVSGLQGAAVLDGTRALLVGRLKTAAQAIAERERDPFIIARHTLSTVATIPEIRDGGPTCSDMLKSPVDVDTGVIAYSRSDASGRPLCASLPFDPNQTFKGIAWWDEGVRATGFSVSNPVVGVLTKQPVIAVNLPIYTDGKQNGLVTASVSLKGVQRSLSRAVRGTHAVAGIVSENGEILLSTGSLRFSKPVMDGSAGPLATLTASDGSRWHYAVTPLERRELFVLYAEPSSIIMAPTIRQLQVSLLLPLVAMLFASLAIWFGTDRWVVRWLRRLGELAGQFAAGKFGGDEESFRKAPQEVATLSDDLHAMARSIEARDAELIRALEIKTELTREIHHRVKNNLQIVMSLLTLQAARIDESDPAETLAQTRARIAALALIHRLMYQQEESENPNQVGVENLLGELCQQLRTSNRHHPNIELECDITPYTIGIDHAVPLALFVVEAITNAYRHAFDEEVPGIIKLTFEIVDGEALLSIADNGRGFQDMEQPGRMGTDLMNAFAEQVGGRAMVESTPGKGTVVRLAFPALETESA